MAKNSAFEIAAANSLPASIITLLTLTLVVLVLVVRLTVVL